MTSFRACTCAVTLELEGAPHIKHDRESAQLFRQPLITDCPHVLAPITASVCLFISLLCWPQALSYNQ